MLARRSDGWEGWRPAGGGGCETPDPVPVEGAPDPHPFPLPAMGEITGPLPSARSPRTLSEKFVRCRSMSPEARATLAVVVVAVAWGSVGVFVREVDVPAVVIVAARAGLAAAALGIWLWRRAERLPGAAFLRHDAWRTLLNGVVLAVHWVTFIAALQRAPIGNVLLVLYLAPVGIAVLAPKVLGEKVSPRT